MPQTIGIPSGVLVKRGIGLLSFSPAPVWYSMSMRVGVAGGVISRHSDEASWKTSLLRPNACTSVCMAWRRATGSRVQTYRFCPRIIENICGGLERYIDVCICRLRWRVDRHGLALFEGFEHMGQVDGGTRLRMRDRVAGCYCAALGLRLKSFKLPSAFVFIHVSLRGACPVSSKIGLPGERMNTRAPKIGHATANSG